MKDVWAGKHATINLTVADDDGNAVDLTSITGLRWAIGEHRDAAPVIVKSSNAGGVTITTPASGIIAIALLPADTLARYGIYHAEAEIVAGGEATVVTMESIRINKTLIDAE